MLMILFLISCGGRYEITENNKITTTYVDYSFQECEVEKD